MGMASTARPPGPSHLAWAGIEGDHPRPELMAIHELELDALA
jgi:hypothetical protein